MRNLMSQTRIVFLKERHLPQYNDEQVKEILMKIIPHLNPTDKIDKVSLDMALYRLKNEKVTRKTLMEMFNLTPTRLDNQWSMVISKCGWYLSNETRKNEILKDKRK